ncbi:putative MFS family arabinose efflux permease [Cupriavidus plantarum]|nr:putative MFS family arabinose efflux permease [Cupriavidus plantarum]RLK31732.1 putative MFS family arabinose efflux permease [Cupriavidus plantarum]
MKWPVRWTRDAFQRFASVDRIGGSYQWFIYLLSTILMNDATLGAPATLARAPSLTSNQSRVIAACSVGNALEMYDFTVYSFFAVMIGKLFFPATSPYASLLLAVATFGIGFVMRPLGGFVIGSYADRSGRKAAMTLTIGLMVVGTLCIACAPTYAMAGAWGPAIIVAGRLLQGFSLGGEIGASTSMLMEAGGVQRRGYRISWQAASQGAAALLGAATGTALYALMPAESLEAWGWRLPFLLGLLIAPVGLYIRANLDETLPEHAHEASPLRTLFREHGLSVLQGVLSITAGTVAMYLVVFYMPTYMIRVLGMPSSLSLLSGCVAGATMIVSSLLAGRIADRLVRRKPIALAALLATTTLIYPAFWLINTYPSVPLVLAVTATLTALGNIGSAPMLLLIMEMLPAGVRASGLSVIYSIGVTIFGGSSQAVVTWLIGVTGNPMAPALYMMACGVVTLFALSSIRETGR